MTGESCDQREIKLLRDAACCQFIILKAALPFSDDSACGYNAVQQGAGMWYAPHPLHYVHLRCRLVNYIFPVAVGAAIWGVVMLMGNGIAVGKLIPTLDRC